MRPLYRDASRDRAYTRIIDFFGKNAKRVDKEEFKWYTVVTAYKWCVREKQKFQRRMTQ